MPSPKRRTPKKNKKRIALLVAIVLISIVAVVCAAFLALSLRYYFLMNYEERTQNSEGKFEIPEDELQSILDALPTDEPFEDETQEPALPPDTGEESHPQTPQTTAPTPPSTAGEPTDEPDVDDVTNILLIGADYVGDNGLSDIMVVVSINDTEKTVTCTSLMRDTYAYIPINQGVNKKLNAAHQLGGSELLIATIELNFGIKIDNYIKVDFEKAVQVFDLLGGLELRIDEAEVNFIRKWESSSTLTYDASKADADGFITVHLDGGELRAHARNRSTGGRGDFNRTRRQRDILYAAFEKCKTMSVPKLATLLENILPLVTTDISYAEFMSHVLSAPSYKSYQFETFRIPCDGYWKYWKYYVVVTDLEKTMEKWRDIVYN